METRYFIFTAAIILLQLLIYIFNKTLIWWLNKTVITKKPRQAITLQFCFLMSWLLPYFYCISTYSFNARATPFFSLCEYCRGRYSLSFPKIQIHHQNRPHFAYYFIRFVISTVQQIKCITPM